MIKFRSFSSICILFIIYHVMFDIMNFVLGLLTLTSLKFGSFLFEITALLVADIIGICPEELNLFCLFIGISYFLLV